MLHRPCETDSHHGGSTPDEHSHELTESTVSGDTPSLFSHDTFATSDAKSIDSVGGTEEKQLLTELHASHETSLCRQKRNKVLCTNCLSQFLKMTQGGQSCGYPFSGIHHCSASGDKKQQSKGCDTSVSTAVQGPLSQCSGEAATPFGGPGIAQFPNQRASEFSNNDCVSKHGLEAGYGKDTDLHCGDDWHTCSNSYEGLLFPNSPVPPCPVYADLIGMFETAGHPRQLGQGGAMLPRFQSMLCTLKDSVRSCKNEVHDMKRAVSEGKGTLHTRNFLRV